MKDGNDEERSRCCVRALAVGVEKSNDRTHGTAQ